MTSSVCIRKAHGINFICKSYILEENIALHAVMIQVNALFAANTDEEAFSNKRDHSASFLRLARHLKKLHACPILVHGFFWISNHTSLEILEAQTWMLSCFG